MTRKLSDGAIWLAIGFLSSYLVHLFPMFVGQVLLPLHFVVLLAGKLSGPAVGSTVGFALPLVTAITLGRPPLQPPIALFMSAELLCYGLIMGLMKEKNVYMALVYSWIAGRVVFSFAVLVVGPMLGLQMDTFSSLMVSVALGIPGAMVQFLLIPTISKRVKLSQES